VFLTKASLNKAPEVSYTFKRNERLKSKILLTSLFEKGSFLFCGNLKVKYLHLKSEETIQVQTAFSVPKSKFKSAVDRNYLKRRMRQGFRIHKHTLYKALENKKGLLLLMFIFNKKEKSDQLAIDKDVIGLIEQLIKKLHTTK
jgi:ribonuclease P protein component